MGLGSNLSPGPMTSMGKTQGSIFSISLGLGSKFRPKRKAIMGKTKPVTNTSSFTAQGILLHLGNSFRRSLHQQRRRREGQGRRRRDGERKVVAAVLLKLVTAHTSLDKTRSQSGVTRGEGA